MLSGFIFSPSFLVSAILLFLSSLDRDIKMQEWWLLEWLKREGEEIGKYIRFVGNQANQIYFACSKHDLEWPCKLWWSWDKEEKRELKGEVLYKTTFVHNVFHLDWMKFLLGSPQS